MDTSYDDEGVFAGIEDIRSSSESASSGASAEMFRSTLKKNLSSRFEDEVTAATAENTVVSTVSGSRSTSSTTTDAGRHHRLKKHPFHQQTSSGTGTLANNVAMIPSTTRPPLHTQSSIQHLGTVSKNKFSVLLRIRPASSSKSSTTTASSNKREEKLLGTAVDTIEILNGSNDKLLPNKIRTYPPTLSNSMRINVNRQFGDVAATSSTYAKEFEFDGVLGPTSSQQAVYAAVAAPLIDQVLQSGHSDPSGRTNNGGSSSSANKKDGRNASRQESALIFSYGITNAGKTHTILGDLESTKTTGSWGIIPRAISQVLGRIQVASNSQQPRNQHQTPSSELYLSFFEIYNEQVYDLLPDTEGCSTSNGAASTFPASLKIRECRGQVVIRGLKRHKISNIEHGISLCKLAHKKRHTSSNNLNKDSSRSHFICQMKIVKRQSIGSSGPMPLGYTAKTGMHGDNNSVSSSTMTGYTTDEEIKVQSRHQTSTVWIVDLAGSERSKRTNVVSSARQKESIQINQSLMTLMRCLNGINESGKNGSNSIIPYRNSKLTHVFQTHLTSISAWRTAMIVNVNPAVADFDETQHVLAYARTAKLIKLNPEEFGKKRKQFFGDEYGMDGRKKVRPDATTKSRQVLNAERNPQKKTTKGFVSRMVEKLSPKRVLKKPGPERHNSKSSIRIDGSSNREMSQNSSALVQKASVVSTSQNDDQAFNALQKSLELAREEISRLSDENAVLKIEMDKKEDQIRSEVAEEMESLLRETRAKYQAKYDQLRSQHMTMQQKSNTSLTISRDKAELELEELMDKIDEAESEMARMTHAHSKEIASKDAKIGALQRELNRILNEKEEVSNKLVALEANSSDSGKSSGNENEENDSDEPLKFNKFATKTNGSTMKDRLRKRRRPLATATNL